VEARRNLRQRLSLGLPVAIGQSGHPSVEVGKYARQVVEVSAGVHPHGRSDEAADLGMGVSLSMCV
jgi:hypothetical protein